MILALLEFQFSSIAMQDGERGNLPSEKACKWRNRLTGNLPGIIQLVYMAAM